MTKVAKRIKEKVDKGGGRERKKDKREKDVTSCNVKKERTTDGKVSNVISQRKRQKTHRCRDTDKARETLIVRQSNRETRT